MRNLKAVITVAVTWFTAHLTESWCPSSIPGPQREVLVSLLRSLPSHGGRFMQGLSHTFTSFYVSVRRAGLESCQVSKQFDSQVELSSAKSGGSFELTFL